ncbi:sigma-70 family RNA polymerase sigma factor [Candidatus Poribacteria bacterium]|nr:sigma-70 family RNA polymerase sigma factor [Candidatus Poribacteria bacterium]
MRVSDEELMRRCCEGDTGAFELLVMRYKDSIFNFTYRFLADYHQAQDLTQETFLRLLKNSERYKSRDKFKPWLYKIAANLCKNEIRNKKRHPKISLDEYIKIENPIASSYSSPDEAYERKELSHLVKDILASIPEDQRMIILMREYQDLSYEEISSALGCSLGAVKSKIYRARQNIKEILIKQEIA